MAGLGGYLFSLVGGLWLFRLGGNGRARSFYCLLVLVAVGRSWWAAWVSPPWLMSILGGLLRDSSVGVYCWGYVLLGNLVLARLSWKLYAPRN